MNPNPAIDRVRQRASYGQSRFLFGVVLFVGVLSAAANPASAFDPWQDSRPVPVIDHGLTDEEYEFINRPITGMTEEEKARRDELLHKMRDHIEKIMSKKAEEKEGDKADKSKPTIKRPIARRPTGPPKNGAKLNGKDALDPERLEAEPPERAVPRRPRRTFAPITGEPPAEPEDNYDLPFDQRVYSFGLRNGNYLDLVTFFEMKTGLPVMGVPVILLGDTKPEDSVISYVSAELTDFRTTLHQINDLLFYGVIPPLYLYYNADDMRLELDAFKELRFKLPPSRLFTSLEAVDQAVLRGELMGSDIVRVFFTPKSASQMRVFNELVSSMFGESVLMSPVEGTGVIDYTGRVDILKRIKAYLVKLEDFGEEADLQILPLLYIKPSKALERLMDLVDNVITGASEGVFRGGRTPRRGGRSSKDDLTPEAIKVLVIADDAHEVLLVRGLPYKVNEIKKILEFIDVPTPRPDFAEPVVVSLEYAQAEIVAEVLEDIMNPAGRRGPIGRSTRGKKGATIPIMTANDETMRVIPDPLRNSLILIGPDEMVAHAQFIIKEVLDKPREDPFQRVTVKQGNAEEIAATVESLLSEGSKGKKGSKLLIMEVVGDDIFMRGEPAMMKVAEELIQQLDGQSARNETFVYRPENASPSDIVDFLRLQSVSGSEKLKKGGRRKPGLTGVGKFYSDEVRVFFTGTQREWESEILPKIKLFDEELPEDKKGVEFVQVIHANPNDVVSSLNLLFDVGKRKDKSDVRFVPTARGVVISGAVSGAELADIRGVIELLDANPNDPEAYERRTFKLTHAEPEDVEDAISTMFGRPRSLGGGRKPKGMPTVSGEDIRIALTSGGLIVAAPKEKMPDIAALVEEMDSEVASVVLVQRVLPLTNADPAKVETAIHSLYGAGAGAAGAKRRAQAGGKTTKDTIRTTTSTKGIFVIAAEEKMPKIEALVLQMDQDAGVDPPLATRFEIMHADAELLAERLEPMLQVELASYQADASGKPKRGAGQAVMSIQANSQTHSVYVVAPRSILERAAAIIAMLDQEAEDLEPVHEIYTCVNARADDLADLLNVIYSGASLPTRTKGGKKRDPRKERDRVLRRLAGGGAGDVEILPLPGDKAISISGPREKVDKVLARAAEIDAKSDEVGLITRTFTLLYADVDSVADGIIEMLGEKGRGAARKASDDLDLWDFEPGPQRAGDISVWPRYETSSLMVVAPADKMVGIEGFIQECERIADPETDIQVAEEPFEFYKPKYMGAYEVVSMARTVISIVYPNSLPVELDYMDKHTVVLKGTRRYFDKVIDLISTYVDTKENARAVEPIMSFAEPLPSNIPAQQVWTMVQSFLPDLELEVQSMSERPGGAITDSIPEIQPKPDKK